MKAARDGGGIRLELGVGEAAALREILGSLAAAYRMPPDQIDPQLAAVWYSTRGCRTAGMSADETRDWLRELHGFKGANLALIEDCSRQLDAGGVTLQIPSGQAVAFVGVLNDHRLRAAAQCGIGQAEMDVRTPEAWDVLGPAKQSALVQIHFLALMMEHILALAAPDASGWMG